MFFHVQKLINPIIPDEPDPAAANALQEGLGGQFGEMRTMMQYLFQSFNFRGTAQPYKDLIQGIGTEEISHVELIATTINHLLDGSPRYKGKNNGTEVPGAGGKTPLEIALNKPGTGQGAATFTTSSSARKVRCRLTRRAIRGAVLMFTTAATSCSTCFTT